MLHYVTQLLDGSGSRRLTVARVGASARLAVGSPPTAQPQPVALWQRRTTCADLELGPTTLWTRTPAADLLIAGICLWLAFLLLTRSASAEE